MNRWRQFPTSNWGVWDVALDPSRCLPLMDRGVQVTSPWTTTGPFMYSLRKESGFYPLTDLSERTCYAGMGGKVKALEGSAGEPEGPVFP